MLQPNNSSIGLRLIFGKPMAFMLQMEFSSTMSLPDGVSIQRDSSNLEMAEPRANIEPRYHFCHAQNHHPSCVDCLWTVRKLRARQYQCRPRLGSCKRLHARGTSYSPTAQRRRLRYCIRSGIQREAVCGSRLPDHRSQN